MSAQLLLRRAAGSAVGLGIFMMFFGDFMFAVNDVMGKWLAGTFSAGQIVLMRSLAALVVLAPLLLKGGALIVGAALTPFDWVTPGLVDLLMLAALGVISMAAHLCIARSVKLAPAAVVAPIQYSLLLWAILFGWLVFGDRPRPSMLIGAAVIVVAGLMVVGGRGSRGRVSEGAD